MLKTTMLMAALLCVSCALGAPAAQEQGYFEITQGDSAMFYWLYRSPTPTNKLILWLQGGPGASSLLGDFAEHGPLDIQLKPREYTWLRQASLLYVDSPVGTGYSYCNSSSSFTTTNEQIADQLVVFLTQFMSKYPEFSSSTEFWIACESYGGKVTAVTGEALYKAIKAGKLDANFKGVMLGDGWVDPIGAVYSYAPYLYSLSLINQLQYDKIVAYADAARAALNAGNGAEATNQWGLQQEYIGEVTAGVNWYNVLNLTNIDEDALGALFAKGGPVRTQLGSIIPSSVDWGSQGQEVFQKLAPVFMEPAISSVDFLLTNGLFVNVYSGQLDLIVDVLNTIGWINKLQWTKLSQWQSAPRRAIMGDGQVQGFMQCLDNFCFSEILRCGHMVPMGNPIGAFNMLNYTLNGELPPAPPALKRKAATQRFKV